MLISLRSLTKIWRVDPIGVVHVGAHLGEEESEYRQHGFGAVLWVEANPVLAELLAQRIRHPSSVKQALVWSQAGQSKPFKISNNGESSSVFELGTHGIDYPDVHFVSELKLTTETLFHLIPDSHKADFLNLDIQGAEYEALVGLGEKIQNFNYIYSEVSRIELYSGINKIERIDEFLASQGFIRVCVTWSNSGWGDAFYVKATWLQVAFPNKPMFFLRKGLFALFLRFREITRLTFLRPSSVRAIARILNRNIVR